MPPLGISLRSLVAFCSTQLHDNLRNECIERDSPGQRVCQSLLQLVELKVFVSDALLVRPNSLDSQDAVPRLQPPRVELIIRHNKPKHDAQGSGQQSIDEEDNLPSGNR